jgi:hypothetical protein
MAIVESAALELGRVLGGSTEDDRPPRMERSLRWREWPVRRPPVSADAKREEGGGTEACEAVVLRFLGELYSTDDG